MESMPTFWIPSHAMERFPFGIYYRETPNATEVFAVLDLRKNPVWLTRN
jgi:hypothetical protein